MPDIIHQEEASRVIRGKVMTLCFTLSMPNIGSWNGKWSGEGLLYAKVVSFGRDKNTSNKAKEILEKGYYSYNFGDGWRAGVSVKEVDVKEAAKIRRKSCGFCGYDWMIDSIKDNNRIEPRPKSGT